MLLRLTHRLIIDLGDPSRGEEAVVCNLHVDFHEFSGRQVIRRCGIRKVRAGAYPVDGFAEIDGDKVSILAESAIAEEKIDVAAAEKASFSV